MKLDSGPAPTRDHDLNKVPGRERNEKSTSARNREGKMSLRGRRGMGPEIPTRSFEPPRRIITLGSVGRIPTPGKAILMVFLFYLDLVPPRAPPGGAMAWLLLQSTVRNSGFLALAGWGNRM
jgi:hypothetical protein